jgi:predicted ArsR family transcriptional regulator
MTDTADEDLLGPSRSRVLRVLRAVDGPLAAPEVAGRLGIHPNSARFHLDALVAAGLAGRGFEDRAVRGRPKVLYTANTSVPASDGGYRELAEILTDAVTAQGGTPSKTAEAAGASRGRVMAAGLDRGDAPVQVVESLRRLGFDSTAVHRRGRPRIEIRPCPFLDLARAHGEVVCSVHRGLVSGMLSVLDPSLAVERLEPFATSRLCVAHLRRESGPHEAGPTR